MIVLFIYGKSLFRQVKMRYILNMPANQDINTNEDL